MLVLLDGKNTHCWDGMRSTFRTKSLIFSKSKFLVRIKLLNPVFLLKEALEPSFPIRMRVGECLEKGGRAIVMEIDGTDK